MNKDILTKNDIENPISIFDIDSKMLSDFFLNIYSYRSYKLENFWKWLYRVHFLSKKNPIVFIKNQKIVGHMGLIPFWLNVKGKKVTAAWYADLYVLPEFRGQGIATKITEELMKLTDVYLSFGNKQSLAIFKKYGWQKTYDTYLHYFFLKPMDHPKFIKFSKYLKWIYFLINYISKYFFSRFYALKINKENILNVHSLNQDNIKIFINSENTNSLIKTIIDEKYMQWRFLESPDLKNYKIFSDNNMSALVRERKDKEFSWHLDILLMNNLKSNKNTISLLASIILWAKKYNYSYVRLYVSDKKLSRKINHNLLSIVRHPRFAYFSKNKKIMEILKTENFLWQLADSDFEFIS